MAVNPRHAFLSAARTDHAAGIVLIPGRVLALLTNILSPPPQALSPLSG
jgi:hypothetical protein